MDEGQLKAWTKQLAIQAAALVGELPRETSAFVFGKQLIRSTSSVGANYRSACRARSDLEMIAKLGVVEEEADEAQYWLELLAEANLVSPDRIKDLHDAYNQIVAIMVASRRTLRSRLDVGGNAPR